MSISFHVGTILTIHKGERCIHLCEPVRAWSTDSTITIHVQQVHAPAGAGDSHSERLSALTVC